MILNKSVVVVLPAYNAEKTLARTYSEIPLDIVDDVILVDDCSWDGTVAKARELGIRHVFQHEKNLGYGANQKNCYRRALELGADIVVMLHPDYQYTPKLIRAMTALIAEDLYDVVLGSRILGTGTLEGGMPLYKYISNRALTLFQNLLISQKLSEYHTGYRAYSRKVLETLPFEINSDDFVFDNELLVQAHFWRFKIAEVSCPTKYFPEASSINFKRSVRYGILCCATAVKFVLHTWGVRSSRLFQPR